jgi:hypothetical protein
MTKENKLGNKTITFKEYEKKYLIRKKKVKQFFRVENKIIQSRNIIRK